MEQHGADLQQEKSSLLNKPQYPNLHVNGTKHVETSPASNQQCAKRRHRFVGAAFISIALTLLLLRPSFLLDMGSGCSGHRSSNRLLRFSPTHTEWVPSAAIDYLSTVRDAVDVDGNWVPIRPDDVDAAQLRRGHPQAKSLLQSVSDEAIKALAGREGYKVGYLDITEAGDAEEDFSSAETEDADGVPYKAVNATAHPEYKALIDMVSVEELKHIVGNLSTGFKTRYYRSYNARAPAEWIQSYLEPLPNSTVTLFENSFNQPNVITRLSPPTAKSTTPTILLGGHLDSTSPIPFMLAPGADDDASGTAVVMHVISILAKSGWVHDKAKYPIEAHSYGGEEGGLLGAVALSKSYKHAGRKIRGVLNVEMVGWQPESGNNSTSTITVLSDPNPAMSAYMKEVVETYVPTSDVRGAYCGYGCSDHYAWSGLGYPVVCIASYGPNDRNLNPNYHSTRDRMESLDFDRMADFARAALAWVVQVAT